MISEHAGHRQHKISAGMFLKDLALLHALATKKFKTIGPMKGQDFRPAKVVRDGRYA